ncbi:hypothetical protein L1D51_21095, partial [Pseudoalteromonas shioyasakiensis]|uniref:hypothetical protein n=1 Tax=Pseudoalteromonas shioyasakiensis TaxID=1190813 RepID=UPI001EFCD910
LIFKRKTLPLFFLFLSALSLAKVMLGRGQSTQGISAISEQFSLVWDVGIFNVFFMSLYNLAEGGLNIANSFLIDQRHSELYKILSFSPLPSFIDGFSSISETESIRLHTYVPMSGISEVYLFGGVYPFVFYFFLYIIFVNVERLRFTKGPGLYVLFSVITLYSVSTLFSYSLRTTWKIMLLILVVSFLLNLTGRKSLK